MKKLATLTAAGSVSVALSFGCSSADESVNLGGDIDRPTLSTYVDTWEGYVEGDTLGIRTSGGYVGVDKVTLTIDEEGGSFVIGEPPYLTTEDYIAQEEQQRRYDQYESAPVLALRLIYPVNDLEVSDNRIVGGIDLTSSFCERCQDRHFTSEGQCFLVGSSSEDLTPVACGQFDTCGWCGGGAPYELALDGTLSEDGNTLRATLPIWNQQAEALDKHTLIFNRQQ